MSAALARVLSSMLAFGRADLTPCVGTWVGEGKDPWLDDPPYAIEVEIFGGEAEWGWVYYDGLGTAKWTECTAKNDWVRATEVLIEAGTCAPAGQITVRCVDRDELQLRWEGEPGVMKTTLRRKAVESSASVEVEPPSAGPVTPPVADPAASPAEPPPGGCGCDLSLALLLPLGPGWRRRSRLGLA